MSISRTIVRAAALVCFAVTAHAADVAAPPIVLAVDAQAQLVVVEVPGGSPQIVAIEGADPSELWTLTSVTDESAQFQIKKRRKNQPHLVRVYLKSAQRAPLAIQDQIEIPPVPRMILTPVETISNGTKPNDDGPPSSQELPQ